VRSSTRIGLVAALSVVVVLGASGVAGAKPKEVSTKKFAKTVCGVYTDLQQQVAKFTDAYNADTSNDPATFQTEVGTLTSALLDDVAKLRTKIKNVYPDVDDGKKITKLFVKNLNEVSSEVAAALEKFQAADPNGVAFQADVSTFEVAINLLDTKSSDPFSKVTDQDVLGAFGDEKSCEKVVTIYGG